MTKVDAQRAMREARYLALQAQAEATRRSSSTPEVPAPTSGDRASTQRVVPAPSARSRAAEKRAAGITSPAEAESVCGHRSISNRSCQRPAGHAEKAHRYK